MASSAWRDPWLIGLCLATGCLLLLLWAWVGERFFDGTARSLLVVDLLVLAIAVAVVLGVVKWRSLPRKAILVGLLIATTGFFLAMAAGMALIASQEGHCAESTMLHAEWHEPGVYEATANGVPGTTLRHAGEFRVFMVDGDAIDFVVFPDDRVTASSPSLEWSKMSGAINQTLGQVVPLTYEGLQVQPESSVC